MVLDQLIARQYECAIQKFPKLNLPTKIGETWEINGYIDVIDDEGCYWDTYNVKIVVPPRFPDELFELYETGGKIPKEADWHNSTTCCLSTPSIMFSEMRDNITLSNWLEKFAHPFLANHVYKVRTGNYASEEFQHGDAGILQGYFKLFNSSDTKAVIRRLELMIGKKKLGRNEKCFCGSNEKYKKCFLGNHDSHLLGIPVSQLQKDLSSVIKMA